MRLLTDRLLRIASLGTAANDHIRLRRYVRHAVPMKPDVVIVLDAQEDLD